MKRTNPIIALITWLALALSPSGHSADGNLAGLPGSQVTLSGVVTNSATGRALEGGRVALQGSTREAITDKLGTYRFDNLPPGPVVLSVSYTGLNSVEIPVELKPGAPNRRDVGLTSDIYTLNTFVVAGEREGNAQAITLQRQSAGIKSIVSADAFGSLAGNPADLLARLPGVDGELVGGDMRFIRVRGIHQNLLTVTTDGNRIASANRSGTGRDLEFSQSNADSIERIEVVKSPTPDMDGDSIGGAVNMVTKSAFDSSPERRISGSLGASWRIFNPVDKPHPNYSLAYSEVFAGKLGISFNAGWRELASLTQSNTLAHQQLPDGVAGPAYNYSLALSDFRSVRVRSGAGLKLDYKLSDNTRFSINTQYNKYHEHESVTGATWETGQAVATRDASGNFTGTGGLLPGYTETFTEVRAVPSSAVTVRSSNLYQDGKLRNIQLGGVHRYNHLDIDYSGYSSQSKVNYTGVSTPNFIVRNVGFIIEQVDDPYLRRITQTAGPDWTRMESYTENTVNILPQATWDQLRGAALNVKKGFEAPVPAFIKAGLRWRGQTRTLENKPWSGRYVGPDGVAGINAATGVNDDNLAQFLAYRRTYDKWARYPNLPFPRISNGIDAVQPALAATPQYFERNAAANVQSDLIGSTHFEEDVAAYYVLGNIDLGKLSILSGLRVETTKTEGEGALQSISPEEKARRAAWVGPVTVAEDVRRRIAEFGGRQVRNGENRVVLPGVHFKYSPLPMVVTRLSYATNIGRPGIGQLIPRTNVDYENQTVSSSNPSLEPQTADNFDLSLEYYFEPAGVFTVGVFLKEIKKFIYTSGGAIIAEGSDNGFDGAFSGFAYTTQYNGGFAKIKGLEVSYSQQFTFLPGFWSGLGGFANITKMEATGNYGSGTAIALAPQPKIAGFRPLTGNVGISYIRNKVSLRFQGNYKGRYLNTYNAIESRRVWFEDLWTLDIKARYSFSRRFDVFMDVGNATFNYNAKRVVGETVVRPQLLGLLSPQFIFGINGRL